MATKASRSAARLMMAPAVVLLLGWMLVPLIMTLWFSFRTYLPLRGGDKGWTGFDNYVRFVTSSAFWPAVQTTLIIVLGVLVITVCLGILLAILLDQPMWGQGDCAYPGHRTVLRNADRVRPSLEEHVHGPGERPLCPSLAVLRG